MDRISWIHKFSFALLLIDDAMPIDLKLSAVKRFENRARNVRVWRISIGTWCYRCRGTIVTDVSEDFVGEQADEKEWRAILIFLPGKAKRGKARKREVHEGRA